MAVSFPLSLPSVKSQRALRWRPRAAVAEARSVFTFQRQQQVHAGMIWAVEVELPAMLRADAEEWIGFLLSLNGKEGSFLMGDPLGATPRGAATGTPVVDGAGQSGRTLATRGWSTGVTGILKRGDYLQLGSGSGTHLHKVVADADSDGSGDASLEIWPALRESPSDGDPITVTNTVGLFELATNEMPWDVDSAQVYGIGFPAVEVLS